MHVVYRIRGIETLYFPFPTKWNELPEDEILLITKVNENVASSMRHDKSESCKDFYGLTKYSCKKLCVFCENALICMSKDDQNRNFTPVDHFVGLWELYSDPVKQTLEIPITCLHENFTTMYKNNPSDVSSYLGVIDIATFERSSVLACVELIIGNTSLFANSRNTSDALAPFAHRGGYLDTPFHKAVKKKLRNIRGIIKNMSEEEYTEAITTFKL